MRWNVTSAIVAAASLALVLPARAQPYDLLIKGHLAQGDDVGHFMNEKLHSLAGIRDTFTMITFRAFG